MGRILYIGVSVLSWMFLSVTVSLAEENYGLAHLGKDGANIKDSGGVVVLQISMTQAVPWKIKTIDSPPRLIVELNELIFSEQPKLKSESFSEVQAGQFSPGTSRLVAVLREPLAVSSAEMRLLEDGSANLEVQLSPTTAEDFRNNVEPSKSKDTAVAREPENDVAVVVIDPGHGGIDPGAEANGLKEADLMLTFAQVLKQSLLTTGRFKVVLTREDDIFVPLNARHKKARAVGADVFISLHADALLEESGSASGLTVYTLGSEFSNESDRKLAERLARSDLIAGVDLENSGEDVSVLLLEMARRDTAPRSLSLSRTLVQSVKGAGLKVNSRPERKGNFAVLRSADIPSVLIELGFLSSLRERKQLASKSWQQDVSQAITEALLLWSEEDSLREKDLGK